MIRRSQNCLHTVNYYSWDYQIKDDPHVIIQYIGVSQMMTAKQKADFKYCAYFIAEMIVKYGTEVLEDTANEKAEVDKRRYFSSMTMIIWALRL